MSTNYVFIDAKENGHGLFRICIIYNEIDWNGSESKVKKWWRKDELNLGFIEHCIWNNIWWHRWCYLMLSLHTVMHI